eukprot:scaffold158315_cov34-Tisochrysis_lutea.AAC.3
MVDQEALALDRACSQCVWLGSGRWRWRWRGRWFLFLGFLVSVFVATSSCNFVESLRVPQRAPPEFASLYPESTSQ